MFKLAAAFALYATLFAATAVQGASLAERACSSPDETAPVCQTTDGSPNQDDCVAALKQLSGQCHQYNNVGSFCTSMVTVGTCKIDVCGFPGAEIESGVNCGGYLQTILNDCSSGGRVGGYLEPAKCNVAFGDQPYKLQFSHS